MDQGNGKPVSFKVVISVKTAAEIRQLKKDAAKAGLATQFLNHLAALLQRLRDNPHAVGELYRHYPHLELTVYLAVSGPVAIDFGVHETQPLVFVRRVVLLSTGA
jgi:hypothetical protein